MKAGTKNTVAQPGHASHLGSRPAAIKSEIPKPNRARREDRTHEQDQGCLSRILDRFGKRVGTSMHIERPTLTFFARRPSSCQSELPCRR